MNAWPTTHVYKRVGDCEIAADVYVPQSTGPRPVILWIHGGALIAGDRTQLRLRRAQLDGYLAAGFAVVSIDHRLAPETKLPGILEDLQDAIAWVRREGPELFGADPDRLAVVGHSAGGYLALLAGVHVEPKPIAIASVYGYGDIAGAWLASPDPYYCRRPKIAAATADAAIDGTHELTGSPFTQARNDLYLYYRQQGLLPLALTGRDPHVADEAFDPWCPLRLVSVDSPPTLLIHGDADTDVPVEQSEAMAKALGAAGVECEFVKLTDAPHGFDVEPDWRDRPETREAFEKLTAFIADRC